MISFSYLHHRLKLFIPLYVLFIKPFFDRLGAVFLLTITSPFIFILILVMFIVNNGKVWFIQARPGKGEKLFNVIKFKTMNDDRDQSGNLLPDAKRLTTMGKIIRKTSIDELPQLFNVVKGEMSFVGPRPLLAEYLPLYNLEQRKRHLVNPGITGWAQVNGRNSISWQQKFNYDIWYVNNISFLLDLKIILLTAVQVFKAKGINSATSATIEKFNGKN
jgi:undecaprenyl phosphate N,N'-diacetylbacillosamine 1-phosphate transferase